MLPLLQINNLSVDFVTETGTTNAVQNISFTINRGEILAIVGESGSGKSVTALSILQLLPSNARFPNGNIFFSSDGVSQAELLKASKKQLLNVRGNEIAMIFQEPMTSLNPVLTCGNQVSEILQLHKKMSEKEARNAAIKWFNKVQLPDPENMFNRYPHQLSGGQKQRVMIAMALCCEPSLLICDEPTTALDVTVQKTILDLIRELQNEKKFGVLFITHDLGVVAELANNAIVMYKGSIVEKGTTQQLFSKPTHEYTKSLLACRPVLHKKGDRLPVVNDFLKNDFPAKPVVRPEIPQVKESAKMEGSTEPIMNVTDLSVWFPAKKSFFGKPKSYIRAIDNISFHVNRGETLGIVGESGSGKTTVGRALLRLVEPTAGKIFYNHIDLTARSSYELKDLRKNIQIIFQDPYSSLNPRLAAGAAIAETMQVHHKINGGKRKEKVVELLEKVNLKPEHYDRYPHEFSGGQRQRIVIARALALDPSFLVCDESVSALDVSVQAQVLNLLNDIKKEFDLTILFISHDLSVVRFMCDRILVMKNGQIVEAGTSEEIYMNPRHDYTKKLIGAIPKSPVGPQLG